MPAPELLPTGPWPQGLGPSLALGLALGMVRVQGRQRLPQVRERRPGRRVPAQDQQPALPVLVPATPVLQLAPVLQVLQLAPLVLQLAQVLQLALGRRSPPRLRRQGQGRRWPERVRVLAPNLAGAHRPRRWRPPLLVQVHLRVPLGHSLARLGRLLVASGPGHLLVRPRPRPRLGQVLVLRGRRCWQLR